MLKESQQGQRFHTIRSLQIDDYNEIAVVVDRVRGEKVTLKKVFLDEEKKAGFYQEFQRLSALSHPNLVTFYEIVSEEKTSISFTMEFVHGMDLRSYCLEDDLLIEEEEFFLLAGFSSDELQQAQDSLDDAFDSLTLPASSNDLPEVPEDAKTDVPSHVEKLERNVSSESAMSLSQEDEFEQRLGSGQMSVVDSYLQVDDVLESFERSLKEQEEEEATDSLLKEQKEETTDSLLKDSFLKPEAVEFLAEIVTEDSPSYKRLQYLLPQLLNALSYLKKEEVLHHDLKPENILVNRDGTVKVLNYGDLHAISGFQQNVLSGQGSGTPGFMAPEQIQGLEFTSSSALYALGTMLFEMVCGRPVFLGGGSEPLELLMEHLSLPAPSLAEFAPKSHPILIAACDAMLQKNPKERPSVEELIQSLEPISRMDLPASQASLSLAQAIERKPAQMLGRECITERYLTRLEQLSEGKPFCYLVEADSGLGKTTFLDWLATTASEEGFLVLRGFAKHYERPMFHAFSSVFKDALHTYEWVQERFDEKLEPAELESLSSLFLEFSKESNESPFIDRRAAFSSFRSLLSIFSKYHEGVLILLDDFHWMDKDSLLLLQHLLYDTPERVGFVVASHDIQERNVVNLWLKRHASKWSCDRLFALKQWEVKQLLGSDESNPQLSEIMIEHWEAKSQGNPLFVSFVKCKRFQVWLKRNRDAHSLDSPWEDYFVWSSRGARELLGLLVFADRWVSIESLTELLEQRERILLEQLSELEAAGLIDVRFFEEDLERVSEVQISHLWVAQQTLQKMHDAEKILCHLRWAKWLTSKNAPEPGRVLRHFIGAKEADKVTLWSRRAANHYEEKAAFSLAAHAYEFFLKQGRLDETNIYLQTALSHEKIESFSRAATLWDEVATRCLGDTQKDVWVCESVTLLMANDLDLSLLRLERAVAPLGKNFEKKAWHRFAKMRSAKKQKEVSFQSSISSVTSRVFIDLSPALCATVAVHDPSLAMHLLWYGEQRFQQLGAVRSRPVWEQMAGYLASMYCHFPKLAKKLERYEDNALEAEGTQAQEGSVVSSFPFLRRALLAVRTGAWLEARELFERAISTIEPSEHFQDLFCFFLKSAKIWWSLPSQNLPELKRSIDIFYENPQATLFARNLRFLHSSELLALFFAGEEQAFVQKSRWWYAHLPKQRSTHCKISCVFLSHLPELYIGDCEVAFLKMRRTWLHGQKHFFDASLDAGLYSGYLALAESLALRSGSKQAKARSVLSLCSKTESFAPFFSSLSLRARAYVEDFKKRPEKALEFLTSAKEIAESTGALIDEAISAFQIGIRLDGEKGESLQNFARQRFKELGADSRLLHEDPSFRLLS